MSEWLTVEKIDSQTFAISEYKHWEETHCYLLCGEESAVLIDTGLGVSNIREIVDSLTKLPVMVVTTHIHWDHIGGHKYFDNIAVHEKEKNWLSVRFPIPMQVVKDNLAKIPCNFPPEFDINAYQVFQGEPQKNSARWRFIGFRWTSYSGNSHAGPLSRTLLFLRAGTKIPVFRRFGLQGMPLCLLSNHRPAAFLSVCKAGAEIQNRKDYAWSSRAEYSCFIDKHNRSWICAIGEKRTTQTRKRTV